MTMIKNAGIAIKISFQSIFKIFSIIDNPTKIKIGESVDLDTFIKLPKGTVFITIFPNKINKDGIIIDSDWVDLPIEIKDDQPRELDSEPYFNGVLYLLPRIENPDCDPFLDDFEVSRDLNRERASEFVVDDLASYDYSEGTKFIVFNKEEISGMINHLQTALKYLDYYGKTN